ncbi:MAG: shikimate dehydrogenase [Bacilli bacterium]|nr:shikimate dehydrogenase [Bacilli bacterium]
MNFQLGLIGYPIKHSLSPWIHETFLEKTNLKGTYSIIEIEERSFAEEIEKLKKRDIDGFNVTVPYKEKIIPFLDEIDPQASAIGAVNTVQNKDGKWIGYNTDGIGYMRSLISKYPELKKDKNIAILLLGAGGAAKGILHALVENGYTNITIANRSLDRASELAKANGQIEILPLNDAEANLAAYSLIIQTTSVGMKPNADRSIISLTNVRKGAIVSDIVYQPLVTNFLKEASFHGARIHFGHTMLLYQAQYAFEIWTGIKPEIGTMDDELKTILEG